MNIKIFKKSIFIPIFYISFLICESNIFNLKASTSENFQSHEFTKTKTWYVSPSSSENIITILKKDDVSLSETFPKTTGVWEGYTIEEHTQMVLHRFFQNLNDATLPASLTEKDFTLFLSLHDIGKNKALIESDGNKSNAKLLELSYSQQEFTRVAQAVGMEQNKIKILSALLNSDIIGMYIQGIISIDSASDLLISDAAVSGLDPITFLNLHTLFHKIDAGSYKSLGSLFIGNTLNYNQTTQQKIASLKEVLQSKINENTAASASRKISGADQICQQKFPNYFAMLKDKSSGENEYAYAIQLLSESMHSVMQRVQINYKDPETGASTNHGFFQKINDFVQLHAPGSRVYLSGGVVQSFLGYIYKKLYNSDLNAQSQSAFPLKDQKSVVINTLESITNGSSSKITQRIPTFNLQEPYDVYDNKPLASLDIIGSGNDFNLLIDFPKESSFDENKIITMIEKFIDSLLISNLNKLIYKVNNYLAYTYPMTTLDLIALPLDHAEKIRVEDPTILQKLLDGQIDYVRVYYDSKPAIQAISPLLEIPFLSISKTTLDGLIKNLRSNSYNADLENEISNVMSRARFGAANNLFNSKTPCIHENSEFVEFIKSINQEIHRRKPLLNRADDLEIKALPPIPEYLKRKKLSLRTEDKGDLKAKGLLTSPFEFLSTCTDKGVVYHNSQNVLNVHKMAKNGFVLSSPRQGQAVYGSGFYVANKKTSSEFYNYRYNANASINIPLEINQNNNLRILDLRKPGVKEMLGEMNIPSYLIDLVYFMGNNRITEKSSLFDLEYLFEQYDIDIIIQSEKDIMILNADALKSIKVDKILTQNFNELMHEINDEIQSSNPFNMYKVKKWLLKFDPNGDYIKIMSTYNSNINLNEGLLKIADYYESKFNETDLSCIVSILESKSQIEVFSKDERLKPTTDRFAHLFDGAKRVLAKDIEINDVVLEEAFKYYKPYLNIIHFKALLDLVINAPVQLTELDKIITKIDGTQRENAFTEFLAQWGKLLSIGIQPDYHKLPKLNDHIRNHLKPIALAPLDQIITLSFAENLTPNDINTLTNHILYIPSENERVAFLSILSLVQNLHINVSGYKRLMAICQIIGTADLKINDFNDHPKIIAKLKDEDIGRLNEVSNQLIAISDKNQKIEYLFKELNLS